jgi:hypothetical protein
LPKSALPDIACREKNDRASVVTPAQARVVGDQCTGDPGFRRYDRSCEHTRYAGLAGGEGFSQRRPASVTGEKTSPADSPESDAAFSAPAGRVRRASPTACA